MIEIKEIKTQAGWIGQVVILDKIIWESKPKLQHHEATWAAKDIILANFKTLFATSVLS